MKSDTLFLAAIILLVANSIKFNIANWIAGMIFILVSFVLEIIEGKMKLEGNKHRSKRK